MLFAGLALAGSGACAQSRESAFSNYKLGAGDVISIQVLGEEDLKRQNIRLSDAATISYPILGEIRLLGKTVAELEVLIRDGLEGVPFFLLGRRLSAGFAPRTYHYAA